MYRPISGPIHIDLEGDGDQNQNNAENIVIATANQNEENQDVAQPETVNEDFEDMIMGKQSSIIVREEVTNNSDDDFVNPAPWSKSKGKQKNVTVREEVTNDSDDDFVNPAPWSKNKGNVKRKLVIEEDEIAKIRNSPQLLSDIICALSDEQMQWAKDVGFGSLLDFKLVEMPQRLAYKIIVAFDEKTGRLILKRGDIEINEHAVHNVLGLPCRGAEIKFAKDGLRSKRTIEWRSQFPGNNELQSLIKASEVVDITKQAGHVDEIFKMNFLVVMTKDTFYG
ncbi:hypothetical protein POM88_044197 [Heracleum sosnowskyi]|uniref:Uncharacterized protein n=1 Tax=Heracleum sosnowskyi TaxID=360622 RepID=A0AAD8H3V7_9APIA|nr:hypothetical protein POM88_044197 [Heracleum sosnowskyi]